MLLLLPLMWRVPRTCGAACYQQVDATMTSVAARAMLRVLKWTPGNDACRTGG